MPDSLQPVASLVFGEARHSFVVLTQTDSPWKAPPKHVLSIPAGWSKDWQSDYLIDWCDFAPRGCALLECATRNRGQFCKWDDGRVDEWSIVLQIGGWLPGSHLVNVGDPVSIVIKTTLTLVRPTPAEIRKFAKVRKAVTHE